MTQHITYARRSRTPGPGRYIFRAECDCGWRAGSWHETERATTPDRMCHERYPGGLRIVFVVDPITGSTTRVSSDESCAVVETT